MILKNASSLSRRPSRPFYRTDPPLNQKERIDMKHAWLIIAHNQFGILQRLVSLLDDERSDFFIHIDKKVRDLPNVHADHGHVYFLSNWIDVRWGTYTQIQAEMALFSAAMEKGTYDYFHIISGTTLPLKSMDEIDAYVRGEAHE